MKHSEKIWLDIEGYAKPSCPFCFAGGEPSLDEYGYFCERCGEDLPNGAEFDESLAAYRAAIENERKSA
jgi:hypothetical protein